MSNIGTLKTKVKTTFRTIINPSMIKKISIIVVFILSFLCSGYCSIVLIEDTFAKTIISICTFVISLLLFLLLCDSKHEFEIIKSKKIGIDLLFVGTIAISVLLTMFTNKDTTNFISYVGFGLNVVNGFLIARMVDYKKAIIIFIKTIFYLTLAALFFWIIFIITKTIVFPSLVIESAHGYKYINYFFLSFQNTSGTRLQSIFWEPGLYSSFLVLALAFQPFVYKKIPLFQTGFLVLALILTQSTFGYFCLIIVLLLYAYKFLKNRKLVVFIFVFTITVLFVFIVFYVPIVGMLAKALPSVFEKMLPGNYAFLSFSTRLYSPYINLLIFMKSPFVGNGIIGADYEYSKMITEGVFSQVADSQTSTTFQLMAQFGIFGALPTIMLLVCIFKLKRPVTEKVLFALLAIFILNKEPHSNILIDWIILFILIKEAFAKEKTALLFESSNERALLNAFFRNDDNSIVKRNSLLSLIIKGAALIIGFLGTPIYNHYFSNSQTSYGTWLALLSILSWLMTFDLGLGNGLKNRLIENDFLKNTDKSKSLISSTYLFTSVISLAFFIIGIVTIWTFDFSFLFKNSGVDILTLRIVVTFVFMSICLEFVLKNVLYVLQAMQKQALASFFSLVSSLSLIIFTAIVRINGATNQLITISIFYFFAINVPLILGTIYVFSSKLKYLPFYLHCVKRSSFQELMGLSLGFFAIQIALLLINSTNNILLSSNYGAEYSALYEYYAKFFMMLYSMFAMITLPYWSMITKAKKEHNYILIKKMLKQLTIYSAIAIVLGALILLILQPIFDVWINDSLDIPIKVNYLIGVLFFANSIMLIIASVFTTILNGFSKIKTQIIAFASGAVVKIASFALLTILGHNQIGWIAAPMSTTIALLPIIAILPIETIKQMRVFKNEEKN